MEQKVGFDFAKMLDTELDLLIESIEELFEGYLLQDQKVDQQN